MELFRLGAKYQSQVNNRVIKVTFIILGFLCMLILESVELQLAPPVAEEVQSCRLDPSFLKDVSMPANITCINGVLSLV